MKQTRPEEWRTVADHGWPKPEDYPVWVKAPGLHVAWADGAYEAAEAVPFTSDLPQALSYNSEQDRTITHWQPAPKLVTPEPPKEREFTDKEMQKIDEILIKALASCPHKLCFETEEALEAIRTLIHDADACGIYRHSDMYYMVDGIEAELKRAREGE